MVATERPLHVNLLLVPRAASYNSPWRYRHPSGQEYGANLDRGSIMGADKTEVAR
jgi:hypothetical protein